MTNVLETTQKIEDLKKKSRIIYYFCPTRFLKNNFYFPGLLFDVEHT